LAIVAVPLKYIILDQAAPTDLTALPAPEAVALIRESYGFLSTALDVSIEDGIAILRLDEPRADQVAEALKALQKGNTEAKRGAYQKAIQHYARVIRALPDHVDARRNLAMAHLELGNAAKAKELLRECLKVDPTNVWTYVLLGNVATKHDRNFDVAEFYYEAGLSIRPDDNLLLNNFAALRMEQGRFDEAKTLFDRALTSDPSNPNTCFGRALAHRMTRSPEAAIDVLDRLFSQPKSADIRTEPVYRNARGLHAELSSELASRDSATDVSASRPCAACWCRIAARRRMTKHLHQVTRVASD
jgi:tetratricopeptide (TPR) repeat protein